MKKLRAWMVRLTGVLVMAAGSVSTASAHAISGMRVFPATMSFDDPGVADEAPWVYSHINANGTRQDSVSLAFAKRLTSSFGLAVSTDYQRHVPGDGSPTVEGWDNFTVAAAYQLFVHPDAESIGMLQLADSVGKSGSTVIGSSYSTYTPEFTYGKGFGGLSDKWQMLRPMAFTAAVSEDFPTASGVPHALNWAFSLQYNIRYLQNFVRYVGLKAPFDKMVPIVEFPLQTCLDRGCSHETTGYANPGVIWVGRYFQWGIEAQVPINDRTGKSVGILLGMDFYFDDIAPHSLGRPMFR